MIKCIFGEKLETTRALDLPAGGTLCVWMETACDCKDATGKQIFYNVYGISAGFKKFAPTNPYLRPDMTILKAWSAVTNKKSQEGTAPIYKKTRFSPKHPHWEMTSFSKTVF